MGEYHRKYFVKIRNIKSAEEVFNTDAAIYGGGNQLNPQIEVTEKGFLLELAGFSTQIIRVTYLL